MEGVPRISMMGFPMRRSADTPHFRSRLKSFVSNHYNEDADSYSNEIHELESLRASAVHVSKDYSGCSTLKKYFCQLNFLKSRFPLNEGGSCAVSFSWYDVFSEHVHGWSDVDFEMSCILYNIGALHSELGALDNRQTADGMKTSCTHFQCAAWAFNHLRHNYQKFFTPDVSPDMLNILYNICLAQAQECILEKSLIDNRKSTITAKVALQIVEYYSTALRIIDTMSKDAAQYSDKLIKSVKTWRKLVELKVHYYGCIAYLYRGMQAEDQGKWGERVTMYKAAADKLNTSIKFAKNLEKTDPVHDTLHFTLDVVGGKVAIAEKENEFIYHEKVPELETVMSDVKGVSLVKGIPFKFDDPQVAGSDIFGRLVPMEAHEASSLYSEEKAKILRTYSKKIEEKNEALDKFVLPLQLDQLELHDSDKIPQELIDCCAALSVNQDAVKRLSELMANLSSLYHDVEANLEEIQDHLVDQEKKEKEYQEVVGKRPPNNIINEINREFQKYQSAQAVAAESNKTLHEAMVLHVANLTILMKPLDDVMKNIPKYDELEKNEEALERMKKLSGKVGEMRKQREMLESQLRDSILNDDITKSLVVKKDEDMDTVFKEELQKHDKVSQLLDQNLLAQENIIRALTEANAEYAETRRATVELKRKRDAVIQSFIGSYEAYDELISKCNKGIEFYTKLNTNVEKLLQRMRSVCKVQNEEREINMERIIRKAQTPIVTPGVPNNTNVLGYNNTISGQYPGYPSATPISPVPSSVGYPSGPTFQSPPSSISSRSSGGGHLRLKDYLAMKKEAQNPGSALQNMVNPSTPQPQMPTQGTYDATQGHQIQQPMMSSTPPPVNPSIGVRPAPVGSEDVGKDTSACNYTYPQQPQPSYNNYGYYTPPPTGNTAPSANYHNSNTGYFNQQNYNVAPNNQNPVAATSTHPTSNVSHTSGYYQIPSQPQHLAPTPPQNSTAPSPSVAGTAPTIMSNSQAPYTPVQQHPHEQHMPTNPVPSNMSPYIPNQPGYSPVSSMNTSTYATPVYSSRHYPSGDKPPTEMGNTYSSSYGIPLSYSGPSGYQQTTNSTATMPPAQYPSPAATPPVLSSSQTPVVPPSQSTNATPTPSSYYSSVYHPTANTVTNATYSTGTTATPSQVPSSQNPTLPPGIPETPNANIANPPQQQQVQQPTNVSANVDNYSPATSFLAQYVRQNQGYISSNSVQPPANNTGSSFPSSVNYGSENVAVYPQQSQQVGTYPQTTIYQQSSGGYGLQTNQYAGYGSAPQQQWQQQPTQVPQQTAAPQSSYQQPQPQQSAAPQQSYQQPQSQQSAAPQQSYQQPQSQQPTVSQPSYQQQQNYSNQQQYQPYPGGAPTSVQQGYYNNASSTVLQQQATMYQQPPTQQPPSKVAASSNVDLLSDIDFNAVPSVAPLAPAPATAGINQATKSSTPSIYAAPSTSSFSPSSCSTPAPVESPPHSSTSSRPVLLKSHSSSSVQSPAASLPISAVLKNGNKIAVNHSNNPSSAIINKVSEQHNEKTVENPYNQEALEKFALEVEVFENTVEGLTKKSLNGPETGLDMNWKELVNIQNETSVQQSISVARCYRSKNRFPDILPYDQTRVRIQIPNTNDDYINASFVNDLCPMPFPFIATQAPLPNTMDDFWQMIWEHQVELVICLCSDVDLKEHVYWPVERGDSAGIEHRSLKIILQTKNNHANYVERIMTVKNRDSKQSRVVVHLQFSHWTGHAFPPSPGPFVDFVADAFKYYKKQRNFQHPVLVHCIAGVGKTGVFCVLAAAMQEIGNGHEIPNLTETAGKASEMRKGIMNDKEYLRYTYHSLLYHCQNILIKHGKRKAKPSFEDKPVRSHIRHTSEDFLKEITLDKLLVHPIISKSASTSSTIINHVSTFPTVERAASITNASQIPASFRAASNIVDKPSKLNYTDVPESLTNLDPTTFQVKDRSESVENLAANRRQAFENNKESAFTSKMNHKCINDPLDNLDPLWTLKK